MTIDYRKYAVLFGTDPATKTYDRGGQLASGPLSGVVIKALAAMEKGYVGVRIQFGDGSLDPSQIRDIAARPDFPKP
ncbi:MAG: hypothetical protein KIS73_30470 [Enhydrobacter sp.]|nr:hypothetical protein [Enhydrobacter sp.]